jgi:hypothetical protein
MLCPTQMLGAMLAIPLVFTGRLLCSVVIPSGVSRAFACACVAAASLSGGRLCFYAKCGLYIPDAVVGRRDTGQGSQVDG